MRFSEFVEQVDRAIRSTTAVDRFNGQPDETAEWALRARRAAVKLVPPLNVSVTLVGAMDTRDTTWYPVDPALVTLVSKRIAAFLSEA